MAIWKRKPPKGLMVHYSINWTHFSCVSDSASHEPNVYPNWKACTRRYEHPKSLSLNHWFEVPLPSLLYLWLFPRRLRLPLVSIPRNRNEHTKIRSSSSSSDTHFIRAPNFDHWASQVSFLGYRTTPNHYITNYFYYWISFVCSFLPVPTGHRQPSRPLWLSQLSRVNAKLTWRTQTPIRHTLSHAKQTTIALESRGCASTCNNIFWA